jgi:hypothetical protein
MGIIRTTASFDRELKNEYYITVVAEDGAPSNRSNHYPPGTPNRGLQSTSFYMQNSDNARTRRLLNLFIGIFTSDEIYSDCTISLSYEFCFIISRKLVNSVQSVI